MGQYSNSLNEKTEEELIEISNSISQYNGEFIDDFLAELDVRRMLWDMKVLLKNKDLFTLTSKLESISNSRYLDLLKREIEIRGLTENYQQEKNGFKKEDRDYSPQNNESIWKSIGSIGVFIAFIVFLIKKFIPNDYDNNVQKEYSPINQTPDHSYEIPYPMPTNTHFSPTKDIPISLDSIYKPINSTFLNDYKKEVDYSSINKYLQDIEKSRNTSLDLNEKPTFHDLKFQNEVNKPFPLESNPFSKSNRLKSEEKKLNKTIGNNKIDTNSKQVP